MPAGSDDCHSISGASGSGIGGDELFVQHQVMRLDSLAGLAVRYNVTVSDIKRANGLLSDSAMFARDTLLIPTRPIPIGNECSAMAGMILTQYGQITRDHSHRQGPGGFLNSSAGASRQGVAAIDQLRAHYGLTPHGSPRAASGASSGEHAFSEGGGCRRRPEVEMQDMAEARPPERRSSLPDLNAHAGHKGGPEVDERLRRRRAQEADEYGSQDTWPSTSGRAPALPATSDAPSRSWSGRPPLLPSSMAPSTSGSQMGRQGSGGPTAPPGRRRESFFEKIKRAASQPALAGPPGPSLHSVADSAIASAKPHMPRSSALLQVAAALQGPKAGAKKE